MGDLSVQPHPYGIKPSGNHYISGHRSTFDRLPDELILHLLDSLPINDLLSLCHTCKKLYAYSISEDIWKDIFVAQKIRLPWRGSWRNTVLKLKETPRIQLGTVFSDTLFKPYMNSQLDLSAFVPKKRGHLIPRFRRMTMEEFAQNVHTPFILTEEIKDWPAMSSWTTNHFLERFKNTKFRAECVDWTMSEYVTYMRYNLDESPLYLFDSNFVEKTSRSGKSLLTDYRVPECFDQDLFKLLGSDRPDHRWLIMGPARSGSTFHKDPNGTCAWNAVVTGSKLWIMFPPDCPPPGVYVSADEAEVTSPLSIAEWLITYHKEARHTKGFMEGVCHAGEILYVPSGWWHLVVNLEECIAVTQNFVPRAYLGKVIKFLRDRRDQVSGFDKEVQAYELFAKRLQESEPELWEPYATQKETVWDGLRKSESTGFAFSFESGSDSE